MIRHTLILIYAQLLFGARRLLSLSDPALKLAFIPGFARFREFNGKVKAYAQFDRARHSVPAYKAFLRSRGFALPGFRGLVPKTECIPVADKGNYVNVNTLASRCVRGKLPIANALIDESSGSSGTAVNWVRGIRERRQNAQLIRLGLKALFGKGSLFVINAFAMGSWATGVNITMSCLPFTRLKSAGPDNAKIDNTIRLFGNEQRYLVMGYPPFLKLLVDHSGIDWSAHNVSLIFGGESMSEGMRDYLLARGLRKVYSSFGASDLELNIASENDFTIAVRRLLRDHADLRQKLVRFGGALPMVFQYNPADFLIEPDDRGELVITICRAGYAAPKIRYNLHDRGQVLPMRELWKQLKAAGIDRRDLPRPSTDLPLLLHYGRADMTVSFFGANISPPDIQEVLFNIPALAPHVHSFAIQAPEDSEGNKQLILSVELQKAIDPDTMDPAVLKQSVFQELARVNQDFREAYRMGGDHQTHLELIAFGTGLFAAADPRIKANYIR